MMELSADWSRREAVDLEVSTNGSGELVSPAARMAEHGASALTTGELLGVLIDGERASAISGGVGEEVLFGCPAAPGITALLRHDAKSLAACGVGAGDVPRVLAAVELSIRLARATLPDRKALGNSAATARYLNLRYGQRDQEVFGALYVDVRGKIVGERELFVGRLDGMSVEPRAVLKNALLLDATGVVAFHNHPSGDPDPSPEDMMFTRRLARALAALGVELVDHLVLGGGNRWVSCRERGYV